jgi:hypothetical protein
MASSLRLIFGSVFYAGKKVHLLRQWTEKGCVLWVQRPWEGKGSGKVIFLRKKRVLSGDIGC